MDDPYYKPEEEIVEEPEYNLTFFQAITHLDKGGWCVGEKFQKGCYIKFDKTGNMVLVQNFKKVNNTNPLPLNKVMLHQKYKILNQ